MQLHTPTAQTLLMCSILACFGSAEAQTSPYYIGVSQGFSYDSNLFRQAEGIPLTSDLVSSTGLVAGIDQPIGRQRLYASGNVRNNRYRDTSRLNNNSYGLNVGLDWSTVNDISGTLAYANAQNLARYGDDVTANFTDKNIEKTELLSSTVRKGVSSRLTLEGSVEHRSVEYSAVQYNNLDYQQDMVSLGLRFQVSGLLNVGGGLRYTRGKYPQYGATATQAPIGDTAKRSDVDLNATWVPSGISTVTARLSFGRLTREQAEAGGFSGATGSLGWAYTPTGKLSFNTVITRDTGTESRIYGISPTLGTVSNDYSRLSNSLQVSANYGVSAKIGISANLNHTRRNLVDTVTIGSTGQAGEGSDRTTSFSLAARYMPTRNATISCGLGRESRSTASALSSAYSANTANCSAQLVLQ